jgi:DNA-binding LacI/PurR family transcriptional regulator/AraC-like DNA-binding protein
MARPQVIFLSASFKFRVCGLIRDGMCRYAAARRWDVRSMSWDEAKAGALRKAFSAARPLGFVVECGDGPCDLPASLFGGLPAVFVNCVATPRGRRFVRLPIDNEAIGRAAFDELSSCRPAAYAVVDFRLAQGNWPDLRVKAFKAAVAKAGANIFSFSFKHPMDDDIAGETGRLAEWLAHLPRRTAVFAVNDQTSADVVEAARMARLRIPQDLALLGVDNNPAICDVSKPTLSSIQVDFENAGFLAAKMLDNFWATKDSKKSKGFENSASFVAGKMKTEVSVGPLLAVRRESTRGHGRREPNILAAVELIRRKACDGLTAAQLISHFPGSRWLFELRFREAMGHSVLDEILHVRLEKACTLLAATDTSIDAIADFCGFGSGRALRDHFRSHMKMSMREFRARNRI